MKHIINENDDFDYKKYMKVSDFHITHLSHVCISKED